MITMNVQQIPAIWKLGVHTWISLAMTTMHAPPMIVILLLDAQTRGTSIVMMIMHVLHFYTDNM